MRAIVVGAGDVGYDVARLLSHQRHDVAVIDTDPEKVEHISETLDVMALVGSGTSMETLSSARIRDADLMVAVTDVDEVNIIASMMAERAGKPDGATITIARVRSEDYTGEQSVLSLDELGIDLIIHPEESTAAEVIALLRRAAATDVIDFCGGRAQLVGIRIDRTVPIIGIPLHEIAKRNANLDFRVMGIVRGVRTIIPDGNATLHKNDQIFVISPTDQADEVANLFGREGRRLERCMILGGTNVGARIAAGLASKKRRDGGMGVKLVEADRARAEYLAEVLEGVLVIHGDPSDIDLLVREGLTETDAVVAVTEDEESNLVSCLMAKHLEVRKTVAQLSKSGYIPISQSIGLDAAVSQKLAVSREVLRFLRGAHVRSVATVHGLDAEILELEAAPDSPITKSALMEQKLPKGTLVAAIDGGNVRIATGYTEIEPGERAIVFALPESANKIEPFFATNGKI
ncbi:MAG: Trk system potassium transporter TrkA [Rubricoccaceae bacterium]|nr:Trk system potassium transporter TrkA [Rubricoccaceae bacterium]